MGSWRFVCASCVVGLTLVKARRSKTLSLDGQIAASAIGLIIALRSWPLYASLMTFFFVGSHVTPKAKREERTWMQVVSNGGVPAFCALVRPSSGDYSDAPAVAAISCALGDTLSSELAPLLSERFSGGHSPRTRKPRLVTRPWQSVPTGTNGGVTIEGFASAMLGALCGITYSVFAFRSISRGAFEGALWGLVGSLIDSFLGATCQKTVAVRRKENADPIGGFDSTKRQTKPAAEPHLQVLSEQAMRSAPSKSIKNSSISVLSSPKNEFVHISGYDILSNSQVNLLSCALVAVLRYLILLF